MDPWTDDAALQEQFAWACDAVERICGAVFDPKPTIRSCTTEQFVPVYAANREGPCPPGVVAALGTEPPAWILKEIESCAAIFAPSVNTVFLYPEGMEQAIAQDRAECSTRSVWLLRLVLIHEATHVLDDQRFDHFGAHRLPHDDPLYQDMRLLEEGHAEYVTAMVAAALGGVAEHTSYLALLHGKPCSQGPDDHVVEDPDPLYWEGLRLLRRAETLGGTPLVDRVLVHPPPYFGAPDWEDELLQTRLAELRR